MLVVSIQFLREVDDKEILQELAGKEDIYGGSDEDDPEVAEIVRKKMASAVFLPPRKYGFMKMSWRVLWLPF
jgi:hypothetical protein